MSKLAWKKKSLDCYTMKLGDQLYSLERSHASEEGWALFIDGRRARCFGTDVTFDEVEALLGPLPIRGRRRLPPEEKAKPISITLQPELLAWLDSQDDKRSRVIQALIERAMADDSSPR